MSVTSRQVIVSSSTATPHRVRVMQQVCIEMEQESASRELHLVRDRDTKFVAGFDQIMASSGVTMQQLPIRAPNLNTFTERFIQMLRQECLDHFIVLGQRHLDHLVAEFVEHDHEERPHQGLENRVITRQGRTRIRSPGDMPEGVRCREHLGGVLRHYTIAA